jgi:predicted nucleic acid-binding protein
MTLVDSNVLTDVLTADPVWLAWSVEFLDRRAGLGPLFINEVIYAELSVRSGSEKALRALLALRVELSELQLMHCIWRARYSAVTEAPAVFERECCRISSSAHTRRSRACRFSRAMYNATGPIFLT